MLDQTPHTMQSVLHSAANKKTGKVGNLANITAQLLNVETPPKMKWWNVWNIIKWVKKIIRIIELARQFFNEEIQLLEQLNNPHEKD